MRHGIGSAVALAAFLLASGPFAAVQPPPAPTAPAPSPVAETAASELGRRLLVAAKAGDDAFLLGCGCPLGPAVGVVDAMRIGADVTPYWSNIIDSTVGRGLHGLATRNAVRNNA